MPDTRRPTDVMGPPPARVQEWIDEAAHLTGVPSRLIQTIMYAESKYNPFPADGPPESGEIGPMQLTRPIREGKYHLTEAQARNPRLNTIYGAKHLKDLMDTYQGDMLRTMVAYNGSGSKARAYGANAMRLFNQQPGAQAQPTRARSYGGIPAAGGKPSPGTPLDPAQRDQAIMRELTARAQGTFPGQFDEATSPPQPGAQAGQAGQAPPPMGAPSAGGDENRVWLRNPKTGKHAWLPPNRVYDFLQNPKNKGWAVDLGYVPVKARIAGAQAQAGGLWNRLNTGLISPEQILRAVGRQGAGGPVTLAGAPQATVPANLSQQQVLTMAAPDSIQPARQPYTGPRISAPEASISSFFMPQMDRAMAEFVSSGTSPASLGTMAIGAAARGLSKVPQTLGALSTLARRTGTGLRGLQTAEQLGYGAKGSYDVLHGLWQGYKQGWSPEVWQNILTGGAQAAGMAPGVAETRQVYRRQIKERLVPSLRQYGDKALVSALDPKDPQKLRDAWADIGSDIAARDPKNLEETLDAAEDVRLATLQETQRRTQAASPVAGFINPTQLIRGIRRRFLTLSMQALRDPKTRKFEPEVEEQIKKLDNIEASLRRKPMDMTTADAMVVDLNRRLVKYNKLTADDKRALGTSAQTEAAFNQAWHDSLQEQVELKVAGYKDLKARYGHAKEVANAILDQIDAHDAALGKESVTGRRVLSDFYGALGGTLAGLVFHPGYAGAIIGALSGTSLMHGIGEMRSRHVVDPDVLIQQAMRTGPKAPPVYGMRNLIQPLAAGMQTAYRKREIQDLAQELERRGLRPPGSPALVYPPPP